MFASLLPRCISDSYFSFNTRYAYILRKPVLFYFLLNYFFYFTLQKSGSITYNGHELDEFFVQRTSAYISQTDNHIAELTVRETLDFAARCQGASDAFAGILCQQ